MSTAVFWLTGLSGSGKTTVAKALELYFKKNGQQVARIDGDTLRAGLNSDLGFSKKDRKENLRRTRELAKLYQSAGFIVIVAFITPYEKERKKARKMFGDDYFEIYVDTPLEICQARDPKGLYAKALAGEIKEMTGMDAPYEIPENPDVVVSNEETTVLGPVSKIIREWGRR